MADRRYLHPLDRRQVKALYHLKRLTKRPMTDHLREAVDRYLAIWGGQEPLIAKGERLEEG
jgi:hypothetical protein